MKLYKNGAGPARYYGTLTSISGGRLITKDNFGNEHLHTVAADAQVTCRGKPFKLADLKLGTHLRMALEPDDEQVAMTVECLHIPGVPRGS